MVALSSLSVCLTNSTLLSGVPFVLAAAKSTVQSQLPVQLIRLITLFRAI